MFKQFFPHAAAAASQRTAAGWWKRRPRRRDPSARVCATGRRRRPFAASLTRLLVRDRRRLSFRRVAARLFSFCLPPVSRHSLPPLRAHSFVRTLVVIAVAPKIVPRGGGGCEEAKWFNARECDRRRHVGGASFRTRRRRRRLSPPPPRSHQPVLLYSRPAAAALAATAMAAAPRAILNYNNNHAAAGRRQPTQPSLARIANKQPHRSPRARDARVTSNEKRTQRKSFCHTPQKRSHSPCFAKTIGRSLRGNISSARGCKTRVARYARSSKAPSI